MSKTCAVTWTDSDKKLNHCIEEPHHAGGYCLSQRGFTRPTMGIGVDVAMALVYGGVFLILLAAVVVVDLIRGEVGLSMLVWSTILVAGSVGLAIVYVRARTRATAMRALRVAPGVQHPRYNACGLHWLDAAGIPRQCAIEADHQASHRSRDGASLRRVGPRAKTVLQFVAALGVATFLAGLGFMLFINEGAAVAVIMGIFLMLVATGQAWADGKALQRVEAAT